MHCLPSSISQQKYRKESFHGRSIVQSFDLAGEKKILVSFDRDCLSFNISIYIFKLIQNLNLYINLLYGLELCYYDLGKIELVLLW